MDRPTIAVSMGDPGGIGPEVLVKALAHPGIRQMARFRVYGCKGVLESAAERAGLEPDWWAVPRDSELLSTTTSHGVVIVDSALPAGAGRPVANKAAGELSFRFVEDAIVDAQRGEDDPLRAHAIVTGPISKEAWSLAGRRYPGHTELLATRFRAKRVGMLFESPKLRVILATVHVPLMDIRNTLTIGRIFDAIDLGHDACVRLGVRSPRIGVCGLNPHAGEAGLLGDEETRLIEPAISVAQGHGIDARGPFPGDTIFNRAVAGEFDLVVAMYHDQGLIPVKLLDRDRAVNVSLGLPVVRTSPDHGTAFDIAGGNSADPGSTIRAIELAARLAVQPERGRAVQR